MPGGRNSGAVYNLYKVNFFPVNGTILKTALTNPSEVIRLRQRLDSAVSSSRDRTFSVEYALSMIKTLIDCDEFQDIATLGNLDELLDHNTDLSEKLCNIGDSIVYKLVQWTKRLPFYLELPVEVHTRLLTHKWHELLVLTTSAYQAIQKAASEQQLQTSSTMIEPDFSQEVETNLCTLQNCLTSMMGREITIEQLRQDVGLMIEKITHVTLMFRHIKLTMEEYVCLKVITMLNQAKPASGASTGELDTIHERYMTCLRVYTQHMYPQQATRFQDLLVRLPEIQSAASLLLEMNGTILKTALTNPSEVIRLRQRLDSAVSSSRDRTFSVEYALSMIKTLIDCDEFQDIATLGNLDELLDHNTDLSEKLCNIGDSIVYKLVQWTKRLPFYLELPVEVHTRLLTHKWHELLVLTTSAYQAIQKAASEQQLQTSSTMIEPDFSQEVETNLCTLQNCLTSMMGREITIEQLRQDVGLMIEKITHVTLMFR
ncbi:hypothetical protein YQE_04532, partial [Dendroctonus ponderosae]